MLGRGTGSDPSKERSSGIDDSSGLDEPITAHVQKAQEPIVQKEVIKKQGTAGTEYSAITNCITLDCNKDFGMFEYDVRFKPPLDEKRKRNECLRNMADLIGTILNYDGGETLYLPIKLISPIVKKTVDAPEIPNVQVFVTFRRQRSMDECVHFYNVLFDRIMRTLRFERIGNKYFDPTAPKLVPQHKLQGEKEKLLI